MGKTRFLVGLKKEHQLKSFFFFIISMVLPIGRLTYSLRGFIPPPPPPPLISFALFSHRCGHVLLDPRYAPRSGLVEMATSALSGCVQVTTNIGDFLSCGRSSLLLLVTSSLSEVPSYSLSQVPSQKFPLTPCLQVCMVVCPSMPSQLRPFISSISHGQSA